MINKHNFRNEKLPHSFCLSPSRKPKTKNKGMTKLKDVVVGLARFADSRSSSIRIYDVRAARAVLTVTKTKKELITNTMMRWGWM